MKKKAARNAAATPKARAPSKKVALPKPVGDEIVELSGRVKSFRTNDHDDADGLILDDGAAVRFPPHLGHEVGGIVKRGDKVRIIGHWHITPKGDTHLHADTIENIKSGHVVKMVSPHEKKHAKKHGKKHAKKHGHAPPHEQMLAEIRAIRALLDDRSRPNMNEHRPPHERVLHELRELRMALEHKS